MNRCMIVQRDFGQLGNRLHTHANAVAWCLENKLNLINLSFIEYADWFSKWQGKPIPFNGTQQNLSFVFLRISNIGNFHNRICRSDKWFESLPANISRYFKKTMIKPSGKKILTKYSKKIPKKDLPSSGHGISGVPV